MKSFLRLGMVMLIAILGFTSITALSGCGDDDKTVVVDREKSTT